LGLITATVFTALALAITVSHWEPGYIYKGTNILIGPVHPVLEAEVGVAVAVGPEVAGFVVAVGLGVVGFVVAVGLEAVGLVVVASVAVVAASVAGAAAVGLDVAAGSVGAASVAAGSVDEGFVAAAVGLEVVVELVVAGIGVGAEVAELPA
jgi:hypothetical protein